MKHFFSFAALVILAAASCRSNKSFLERSNPDKSLQEAIKKLEKNPGNDDASSAIPILYKDILASHLANINAARAGAGKNFSQWDNIIGEYEQLQKAYNRIINSTAAFTLVNPQNFSAELFEAKDSASLHYYNAAITLLKNKNRGELKKAYNYFEKADKITPGYKDAKEKMKEAFENATVIAVINPIRDNSFFNRSGWGSSYYNYSNEYFQQKLIRDLSNTSYSNNYPAKFYGDWEIRRNQLMPDWEVNLTLRKMHVPYPNTNYRSYNISRYVEVSRDSLNQPVFKTVFATLNITYRNFTAKATMEVAVTDIATGNKIRYRTINETYEWYEEMGTYTGDSRALGPKDWEIINRRQFNDPKKEYILDQLYRKIYPAVLGEIRTAAYW